MLKYVNGQVKGRGNMPSNLLFPVHFFSILRLMYIYLYILTNIFYSNLKL